MKWGKLTNLTLMYCDNNHNFRLINFFFILIYSFGVLVLNEIILQLYYESLIKDFDG